jgi:hypothetical protein
MPSFWLGLTAVFFAFGLLFLLVSAFVFFRIGGQVLPLLADTQHQIQDLGDLAANTVGRAADTAEIVELRVTQAMGQAVDAGNTVRHQALGVGAALAGLYIATRIARTLRHPKRRRR